MTPAGDHRGAFTTTVTAALDKVFVRRGFLPGQGNDHPGTRTDIIYCTSMDDFARRWPATFAALDARYGNELLVPGGCIDCTVGGTIAHGVTQFDLEAIEPQELAGVGDASFLSGLGSSPLGEQLDAIRSWIEDLLPAP